MEGDALDEGERIKVEKFESACHPHSAGSAREQATSLQNPKDPISSSQRPYLHLPSTYTLFSPYSFPVTHKGAAPGVHSGPGSDSVINQRSDHEQVI